MRITTFVYRTETSWLKIAPLGIKYTLQWVKDRFNNPEVIIIDNGISDRGGGNTNDMQRIFSLKYYLNNILRGKIYDLNYVNC